jgi:hypothetical protein
VVINSGQSQNEAVGSIVEQYTKAATKNVSHPRILSTSLNCFILNNDTIINVKMYIQGAKVVFFTEE